MDWGLLFQTYGLVLLAIAFGAFVARATGVGFALVVVAALLALPEMDQPTALYVAAPLSLLNLGFLSTRFFFAVMVLENCIASTICRARLCSNINVVLRGIT